MSESETSDVSASSDNSNPKKFTTGGLSRILASFYSGRPDDVIDVESCERCEEALDSETRDRVTRIFEKNCVEAETLAENSDDVRSLLDTLKNWSARFARKLNTESFQSLTTIFRMLSATVTGEYQGMSKKTLVYLIGAVLYCVSPIDAIPDSIPVVGLFDDAFVLSWTVKKIADEIRSFRMWERLRTAKSVLACYIPYFSDVKRVVLIPGWMTANNDCATEIDILKPVFPKAEFETFRWESNCSWSAARDYADAQGADDLDEFLRKTGDLGNCVLVGHSLGARIAVRTLAKLAKEPVKKGFWARKPLNRVSQAFLFGAAVDSDDLDLPLAAKGVNAPLCNFFSQSDLVLSYLYRAAEQKAPLGLSGLAAPCDNYVDCVVSGQEEYWLDFAKNIAVVLSFVRSGSILTKFSLAESISAGLPDFFGHQFQLYARFFKESALTEEQKYDDEPLEGENDPTL